MTVTFNISDKLDKVFPNASMTSIFKGYDDRTWLYKGNVEDETANTRTYEFWYKDKVSALDANVELDALFDSITMPGTLTNEQLKEINGLEITVNAYAIQADGFTDATDAWAHF